MKDKDFSGCRFFHDKNLGLCSLRDDCDRTIPKCTPKCKDNPNCDYKQLQAKTDELRIVTEQKDKLYNLFVKDTYESCKGFKEFIQQNTALKQQIDTAVEALEFYADVKNWLDVSTPYTNMSKLVAKTALDKVREGL